MQHNYCIDLPPASDETEHMIACLLRRLSAEALAEANR